MKNNKAYLLLTATALLWGLNFHLAKIMMQYVDYIEAGFWRYLIGVFFLYLLYRRTGVKDHLFKSKKGVRGALLLGVIGIFGFNIFFFWGLIYTSPINGALIIGLNPAITTVLSIFFFGTRVRLSQVLGIIIALYGVLYLLTQGHPSNLLDNQWSKGDLLLMVSTTIFGFYNNWAKKYSGIYSNAYFTYISHLIGWLCFAIVFIFVSKATPPVEVSEFWLSVLGLGILGTSLAYIFWNQGIEMIGPARGALFVNLVPFSASIYAVFFGDPIYSYHVVSGLMIISGILVVQLTGRLIIR